jgi:hypothetical protein
LDGLDLTMVRISVGIELFGWGESDSMSDTSDMFSEGSEDKLGDDGSDMDWIGIRYVSWVIENELTSCVDAG